MKRHRELEECLAIYSNDHSMEFEGHRQFVPGVLVEVIGEPLCIGLVATLNENTNFTGWSMTGNLDHSANNIRYSIH